MIPRFGLNYLGKILITLNKPLLQLLIAGSIIYLDLLKVRNTIDCCIAASAIEHNLLLLHIDKDFEAIAFGTSLNQISLN